VTAPSPSAVGTERAELEREQKRHAQTYWAIVRTQFRKNRTGMVGFWMVISIVAVALLAPLIANDRPIVARYKGSTCFPAFTTYVDTWVFWPSARNALKSWKVGDALPFGDHYEILAGKSWAEAIAAAPNEVGADADVGLVVWPPVRWSPRQIDKGAVKARPDDRHWVGTDDRGRDILARIIHGCVVAVTVGIVATGIASMIGIVLGTSAGFFGGRVDMFLSRIVEVVMCFPTFFVIIAVISFLEPSIMNIMIVIGLFGWTGIYRLIRGEVLKCRAMDYVVAAHAQGIPTRRIMFKHILPNAIAPVFVSISFGIAGAILTEASLTFLGFGDVSVPSWGEIVSQGRRYVQEDLTHLILPAGVMTFVTLTAFNLFGQGLRDAMDPRLRR
jgi:peptide/nickel transport system permease protein